jgi:hypothetical protein
MSIHEDIKAWLDGELSDGRAEEVRAAVEADPELQKEADQLRSLSTTLKDHAKEIQADGLDQALAGLKARPAQHWWTKKWVPIGAAAALVVFAIAFVPGLSEDAAVESSRTVAGNVVNGLESSVVEGRPADQEDKAEDMGRGPAFGWSGEKAKEGVSRAGGLDESAPASKAPHVSYDDTPGELTEKMVDPRADRLIAYSARIQMKVKSVEKSVADLSRAAKSVGGYVEDRNTYSSFDVPTSRLTVRVPSSTYEEFKQIVYGLGEKLSDSESAPDITEQTLDTEARLKTMRAEEESLRDILRDAKDVDDLLSVKDRLTSVRMEIESLDSRAKRLRNMAAMSTLDISLEQEPKPEDKKVTGTWSDEAWTDAEQGLSALGRTWAVKGIKLLVYAPVWVPIMLIMLFVGARTVNAIRT